MTERIVVVTGGGTGIGRGIATRFAQDGDHVVVVGRRQAVLDEVVAGLPGGGTALACDLTVPDEVERLGEQLSARFGTVDVLVNNAGGAHRGVPSSAAEAAAKWTRSFEQNVLTAVLATQVIAPLLRRPGGRVVVIGSMAAVGTQGDVAYSSAKAAVHRWVNGLAIDLGPQGITANVIAPGFVPETELFGATGAAADYIERATTFIARKRPGTPADIANAVAWVASPESDWVNGSVIEVGGGRR